MFDFTKITKDEVDELKRLISKAGEKSAIERFYLYTNEPSEKMELFLFCHRFIINAKNLIKDGDCKNEIQKQINLNNKNYHLVLQLKEINNKISFGNSERMAKLIKILNSPEVDEVIDLFSMLSEKINLIDIGRLKGVIMEGKIGIGKSFFLIGSWFSYWPFL